MGLIGKLALVGDGGQGQVGTVDQMDGMQVFLIKQYFFRIHACGLEDLSR
jgi:hypothetical protein